MWKRLLGGSAALDRSENHRVKALALELLPPGTSVSVNEIFCNDPGCAGIETVILIMRPSHKTAAVKISKYARDVEAADVAAALERNQA